MLSSQEGDRLQNLALKLIPEERMQIGKSPTRWNDEFPIIRGKKRNESGGGYLYGIVKGQAKTETIVLYSVSN